MSGRFPKVCSLGVQRPGREVRFVSVAECSNANSQYVAGSSPDVASKHLALIPAGPCIVQLDSG
jgi:hypothetical protein